MYRCEICDEWVYSDHHKCPPKWEVRSELNGEEWDIVFAFDAEAAAEKYTEQSDDEHYYMDGHDLEVEVREFGKEKATIYECSGEAEVNYHANKKD